MRQRWFYEKCLRPWLFLLESEQAHNLVHLLAPVAEPVFSLPFLNLEPKADNLHTSLGGVPLQNPVGLAAGFDKNGKLVSLLGQLGFGFAEIGSVTARASAGNAKPRLFRLPEDEALINRMGLNGEGAAVIAQRLAQSKFSLPVGINIAKTNDPAITGDDAIKDLLHSFEQVKDLPIRFLTINASCPNTAEGKLEEKREMAVVFEEIQKQNRRKLPIFVKLSPDSAADLLEDLVDAATKYELSGYVCGNTTVSRPGLKTPDVERLGPGGLSGRPLRPLAIELVGRVYKLKAPQQDIVAVGGLSSGEDAYAFIRRGASAVQLYTALVYRGPTLPHDINEELSSLLLRDGLSLQQAIGVDS